MPRVAGVARLYSTHPHFFWPFNYLPLKPCSREPQSLEWIQVVPQSAREEHGILPHCSSAIHTGRQRDICC